MFAQLPHSSAARLLAALAAALTLGVALPASAHDSQWIRSQSNWGNSTGWDRHWRSQAQHHFNTRSQVVIGGGSGIIVTRPGFVVGNPGVVNQPGFIVNQPGFIVNQPGFIVGQPAFVRRPNLIFERPSFARKQVQFIKRHPSLRLGKPWWGKSWKHKRWKHQRWKHQMGGGMNWGGMN